MHSWHNKAVFSILGMLLLFVPEGTIRRDPLALCAVFLYSVPHVHID